MRIPEKQKFSPDFLVIFFAHHEHGTVFRTVRPSRSIVRNFEQNLAP